MEAKTKARLEKVIAEALELADAGSDEFDAAREALTAQTTDVLRELAVAALVDTIRRRQRSNVLSIERESTASLRRARRTEIQSWKTVEYYARADEINQRHMQEMFAIAERYAADLRVEWTNELLASDFALPDGSRVTWGEATIEQHEARAALFQRNALANAEGAARHLHAAQQLKAAGSPTLADLVGRAA